MDAAAIERFSGPVLAERAWVSEQARACVVRPGNGSEWAGHGPPPHQQRIRRFSGSYIGRSEAVAGKRSPATSIV